MKQSNLLIPAICLIFANGCAVYTGGAVRANKPLSQDLGRYQTMAVHFDPGQPSFEEGLSLFRPLAMNQVRAANLVNQVTELNDLTHAHSADLILQIRILKYVKSNVGFWVRGGLADQASIHLTVVLTDATTKQVLSAGSIAGWTVHNESDEQVANRAAANLRRFLHGEYAPIRYDGIEYTPLVKG